jgi:hydrogenase maturation protease
VRNFKVQTSNLKGQASPGKHRILIAGIGNIFMGDDAFGCEVIRELAERELPNEVALQDFGIRSYDLAYALIEDYEAIVLVDAVARGASPGTVFLIEPELGHPGAEAAVDPHTMNPMLVLQTAQRLGGIKAKVYVAGCEPQSLEPEDGQLSLSAPVQAAVPEAAAMIVTLLSDVLRSEQTAGIAATRV